MVTLLRSLTSRLGDTVDAWDRFQRKDIGYFLFDEDSPTASSYLKALVNDVDTIFSDLKDILRKLQHLEGEICQDSPQGVSNPTGLVHRAYICLFAGPIQTLIQIAQRSLQSRKSRSPTLSAEIRPPYSNPDRHYYCKLVPGGGVCFKSNLIRGQIVVSPTRPCFEYVQYNGRFTFHTKFWTVYSLLVPSGVPYSSEHRNLV